MFFHSVRAYWSLHCGCPFPPGMEYSGQKRQVTGRPCVLSAMMWLGRERVSRASQATLWAAASPWNNRAAPGEIYEEPRESRGDGPTDGQTDACRDSDQKDEE